MYAFVPAPNSILLHAHALYARKQPYHYFKNTVMHSLSYNMPHPANLVLFRCIVIAYWHFKIHIQVLPSLLGVSFSSLFFYIPQIETKLRKALSLLIL